MSRLGLLTTALILIGGVSYAADKITLACSGTRLESPDESPVSLAFIIDQDQGIVTPLTADNIPGPPASISENTERRISLLLTATKANNDILGLLVRNNMLSVVRPGASTIQELPLFAGKGSLAFPRQLLNPRSNAIFLETHGI